MRRREFIAGLSSAASWPAVVRAQAQRSALPVIGFLSSVAENNGAHIAAAFRQGLREEGFIEGQNVEILYRWADDQPERLQSFAADLVRRQVAVIATPGGGTRAALVAKSATATIPIVFAVGSDPVEAGLVTSLNRPGGNLTGATRLLQELTAKRLELLHEVVPAAPLIGLLADPGLRYAAAQAREAERAALVLGVRIVHENASTPGEIERALASVMEKRVGALLVGAASLLFNQRKELVALAARYGITAIYPNREYVDAGGLMSYGPAPSDADRIAGTYAARILKGQRPAELPVQQATQVELVVSMRAAKALGIAIPLSLLGRADEVIE